MPEKIFGNHGSKFWNIDPIQLRTLIITHVTCYNIDTNYSIWTVKLFTMLRAEQMNLKQSMNLSLHAGSTADVLDAGSTGDTRVFFLVSGSHQLMNFDENGSVANAFVQNKVLFLSEKVKMTIREAGQSLKSITMASHVTWQVLVLASSYLQLHMIWIIEHGRVEVKACGQNTSQKLVLSS